MLQAEEDHRELAGEQRPEQAGREVAVASKSFTHGSAQTTTIAVAPIERQAGLPHQRMPALASLMATC